MSSESGGGRFGVAGAGMCGEVVCDVPLPMEFNPYGWEQTKRRIEAICGGVVTRRGPDYLTDNGNPILDAHFGPTIEDPVKMEADLRAISGVVEVG